MILAACPHCMQCIGVLYLHLFFACCIHARARALTRKHTHTPLACLLYRRCCQHLAGTRAHLWGGQTQDSMVVTVSDLCSFDARGCRAEAGGRDAHMQEFLRNVCVMRICFCTHVHIHFCMRPCEDHGHTTPANTAQAMSRRDATTRRTDTADLYGGKAQAHASNPPSSLKSEGDAGSVWVRSSVSRTPRHATRRQSPAARGRTANKRDLPPKCRSVKACILEPLQ